MKFGPLQLSYSGIGITVAGVAAIAAVGGASVSRSRIFLIMNSMMGTQNGMQIRSFR